MFDINQDRLIDSSLKIEDESEVSLRPRNISEYIGQTNTVSQLNIFIEAAKKNYLKKQGSGQKV